jgi:hypothetical protein
MPRIPVVYVAAGTRAIETTIAQKLRADGLRVYTPEWESDVEGDTASISAFCCALLHLDRLDSTDAIDDAELMRLTQPTLPVAFIHSHATETLLRRARVLGPVFRISDELAGAFAWASANAKRSLPPMAPAG